VAEDAAGDAGAATCACAQPPIKIIVHRNFAIVPWMLNGMLSDGPSVSGICYRPTVGGLPDITVSVMKMNLSKVRTLVATPVLLAMHLLAGTSQGFASDLKVPLPRRSISTPTQKLNREGVAELKHGHQKKAARLFYRAYLLDPDDPFTLNNLGYIAELDGDADRALRYYALAARDRTDAVIDQSSEAALKGKPLDEAFQRVQDSDQEVSRINERAIVLAQQGHAFEARNLLESALPRHPQDPFLLNNLGYALEAVGDTEGALRSYSAAASLHSKQRVVVTPRVKWRGRPISEVAGGNAAAVSEQIARGEGLEATTARLNLRGVAALNDNHPLVAREFFMQAYQKDAQNAFTLNNLGYVAEMAGDRESAEMYYEAARSGRDANAKVSYATRRNAEGQKIDNLADDNQSDVEATLKAIQEAKRHAKRPIELKRRDTVSANTELDATPVPPIAMHAPALPALPPPDTEQNRNPMPSLPVDSSRPQSSQPQK
jgi:Flp pilus assembly protein TadD